MKEHRPPWDLNPESRAPEACALSLGPGGQTAGCPYHPSLYSRPPRPRVDRHPLPIRAQHSRLSSGPHASIIYVISAARRGQHGHGDPCPQRLDSVCQPTHAMVRYVMSRPTNFAVRRDRRRGLDCLFRRQFPRPRLTPASRTWHDRRSWTAARAERPHGSARREARPQGSIRRGADPARGGLRGCWTWVLVGRLDWGVIVGAGRRLIRTLCIESSRACTLAPAIIQSEP